MARVSRKTSAAKNVRPDAVRIYKTAVYVRLSDEDIRKKTSGSIGTQKAMLLQFIQSQPDLRLYEVYEDINYTGTSFHRPAFIRMMQAIKAGLADCVLVKDVSRLGRNFAEMGHILERVFPLLAVRFISVGDHYDSNTASIDESGFIIPLKNLMNEAYARDLARKVQYSVKRRQLRGEFVGSIAPYGYRKDATAFVIDPETAPVVRQIFRWITEGMSDAAIARKLNDSKVPPPSRYRFEKGIVKAEKYKNSRIWHRSAIKRISENPVYTGVMAQGRHKSGFLQGGGVIRTEDREWIIVENTHPAIIGKDTFSAVKTIREARA